jgi:hypothetical protein
MREKRIKISSLVTFQMAVVAVSQLMFRDILMLIAPALGAARISVRGARIECENNDGRSAP